MSTHRMIKFHIDHYRISGWLRKSKAEKRAEINKIIFDSLMITALGVLFLVAILLIPQAIDTRLNRQLQLAMTAQGLEYPQDDIRVRQ